MRGIDTLPVLNNQQGRSRIWERLDRFLGNGEAFVKLPVLKCSHLTRAYSDHSPLLLSVMPQTKSKSRFIFQRMWLEHPNFKTVVSNVWQAKITGTPSYIVAEKLRRLQRQLKTWNWEIFGDVRTQLEDIRTKIQSLEDSSQQTLMEVGVEELRRLKSDMAKLLRWDSYLLYQKTREKWVTEGDRNIKFFHALIKDRRRRNTIKLTKANGEVIADNKELLEGAVNYFQAIFSSSPFWMKEELFDGYQSCISEEINKQLETIPDMNELWEAVQNLPPDSAPGWDGFTGHFFIGCWEIVKSDIVAMVQGFFLGDHLNRVVKSTMLILIPKVETPTDYSDFRPISLSSFVSKIVTKILAYRFALILPQVIDEEQFGFVKGRQIHESIALAQEMVGDIDRKIEGGNVILKFDMSKAYDWLEWRFLLRSLRAMGFSVVVQDLVYSAISDILYKINIHGEYSSEFRSTRGVTQGDPLSPMLFIMAQQIFSFNLKKWNRLGN